jgi:hypothetical protein
MPPKLPIGYSSSKSYSKGVDRPSYGYTANFNWIFAYQLLPLFFCFFGHYDAFSYIFGYTKHKHKNFQNLGRRV